MGGGRCANVVTSNIKTNLGGKSYELEREG